MELKTLTYTSYARLDLGDQDLLEILRSAREFNGLQGITGLLIFNGTRFLQIIEGPEDAVDELVGRLRGDPRHTGIEICHQGAIGRRSFPDWSMELVKVQSDYVTASDTISERLPADVPASIRQPILALTERISGVIDLRS